MRDCHSRSCNAVRAPGMQVAKLWLRSVELIHPPRFAFSTPERGPVHVFSGQSGADAGEPVMTPLAIPGARLCEKGRVCGRECL